MLHNLIISLKCGSPRIKVSFYSHLSVGNTGSNPDETMGVLLSCLLRV